MLGHVIRRYGPTTMLIVIAVLLWAGMVGAFRRIDNLQSSNRWRLDTVEARLAAVEARLEIRFDALDAQLGTRLGGIEQGQAALRERMARVGKKIEAIGNQLDKAAGGVSNPPGTGVPAD